ncbi:hypothetical protein [Moorena producens]|nr:hypothetical protein [Moorena producens]
MVFSCSLFPVPCSLFPTPYSLLPTPFRYAIPWETKPAQKKG